VFFKEGENCWQTAVADRAAFLVDGEEYYRSVAEACESARQAIYILGWDVDSRIRLRRENDDKAETFGQFVNRLVQENPDLHIYVLEWDFAMFYSLEREVWSLLSFGWLTHERVHFELDDNHPVGACHHQKLVVVDDQFAFVGGFDLASFRWDTTEHLPEHPQRADNGTPYGPVHDVQMLVTGDIAGKIGIIARDRWERATGEIPAKPKVREHAPWPFSAAADFEKKPVSILRTYPAHDGIEEVREIERFYLDAIDQAESYLYMENQYFTSHSISAALEKSLRRKNGPEIVLVLPRKCPGWLEEETMGVLRKNLHQRLQAADEHGRLLVCYPDRAGLEPEFIIVHGKILIADDDLLTVGSANLSNRSMGFDTECNLAVAADGCEEIAKTISVFRNRLLAEHLDCDAKTVATHIKDSGSLLSTIKSLRSNKCSLTELPVGDNDSFLETLIPRTMIDPEQPMEVESLLDYLGFGLEQEGENPKQNDQQKAWRFFAIIIFALLLTVLWRWSPLNRWVNVDILLAAADYVRGSFFTVPIVLAVYLLSSCLIFPINLLILATALSFGSLQGFSLALSGSLLGGLASYLLGRWLGRDVVQKLAGKKLNRLSRKLARRGWLTIALVRVVPIAPFTIVNMVAGASHISARSFLIGTAVGMCPGIFAIMIFEEGLERVLRNPDWQTLGIAVIALCCALLVLILGKKLLTGQEERKGG
jgi:phospholipase D1/2